LSYVIFPRHGTGALSQARRALLTDTDQSHCAANNVVQALKAAISVFGAKAIC